MAACWPLQMPATAKSVLISLADNSNDQFVCWPSIPTICKRVCYGRTAVIKAIQWLEENSLVSVERGSSKSNKYTLTPSLFQGDPSGDYHYVYCITHKPTGAYYIGVRSCYVSPELDDYYGTGRASAWLESVKPECHRAIMQAFSTRLEAAQYESQLLRKHVGEKQCLNRLRTAPATAMGNPPSLLFDVPVPDGALAEPSASRTVGSTTDSPRDEREPSASRTSTVRQTHPNHQEPSLTVKSTPETKIGNIPQEEGSPPDDVDWRASLPRAEQPRPARGAHRPAPRTRVLTDAQRTENWKNHIGPVLAAAGIRRPST